MVLEGVRKPQQIDRILDRIGHRYVKHVHLSVDPATQQERFDTSKRAKDAGLAFKDAINDASEREVVQLEDKADIVIRTERHTEADVFCRVSARLNLQSRSADRLVDVLVGGQYGSEGKGNIADYLSPEYKVLMRVGGPNAGHKVYEEPPYTHISLPCGTRRETDGQALLIGPGAVIEPAKLLNEIWDCEVEPGRLIVDEQAVVISSEDRKWEEENLKQEIGSTAQGVGKATARRVTNRFRGERACKLARDMGPEFRELQRYLGSTSERLEKAYVRGEKILLEGTQGTGLSMFHGDYPSVTSRDTTVSGCLSEAGIGPRRVNRIVLVCRTFPIRVGGESGNFSKEIDWETVSARSGIPWRNYRGTKWARCRGSSEGWASSTGDAPPSLPPELPDGRGADVRGLPGSAKQRGDPVRPADAGNDQVRRGCRDGGGRTLLVDRQPVRLQVRHRQEAVVMRPEDLWHHYPVLYHIAWGGSWPSIEEHGLLSTKAPAAAVRQERRGDRRADAGTAAALGRDRLSGSPACGAA